MPQPLITAARVTDGRTPLKKPASRQGWERGGRVGRGHVGQAARGGAALGSAGPTPRYRHGGPRGRAEGDPITSSRQAGTARVRSEPLTGQTLLFRDASKGVQRPPVPRLLSLQLEPAVRLNADLHDVGGRRNKLPEPASEHPGASALPAGKQVAVKGKWRRWQLQRQRRTPQTSGGRGRTRGPTAQHGGQGLTTREPNADPGHQ